MNKRTILTASAIVAVGCIAIPTGAYAANGGSWLLGRSNSESATTTVTNSAGTPLSLNAKSGYAPLKVNSSKTVTNLSADRLDGLSSGSFLRSTGKAVDADKVDGYHASSFAMRSGKTGTIVHDGEVDEIGAVCPSGTIATGGGGFGPYGSYGLYYSGPDWDASTGNIIPNSWLVMDDYGVGIAYVNCYSPSGAAVPGAVTTLDQLKGLSTAAAAAAGPMTQDAKPSAKLEQFKAAQSGK